VNHQVGDLNQAGLIMVDALIEKKWELNNGGKGRGRGREKGRGLVSYR
jgi:hypothetical protein